MALLYTANTSLDGYTVDSSGSFDFTVPSEEVHAFINDRQRPIGTYLYGRRMYETMRVWQELPGDGDSEVVADYAGIWKAADKVVYSATLAEVGTPRTRLERVFEPDAVRSLVDASDADVAVGGPRSRPPRSGQGSSPRWSCSSRRCRSAAASPRCPSACGSSWPCAISASSRTAPCTCATTSAHLQRDARPVERALQVVDRHAVLAEDRDGIEEGVEPGRRARRLHPVHLERQRVPGRP